MGDPKPVKLHDADAPAKPRHEGSSAMTRVARAVGGPNPWARVTALLILVGGAVAWQAVPRKPSDDCPPLIVQYVLHQAATGAEEADRLDAQGQHAAAESLRRLTDPNAQPDDVRLCLLLSKRESQ